MLLAAPVICQQITMVAHFLLRINLPGHKTKILEEYPVQFHFVLLPVKALHHVCL